MGAPLNTATAAFRLPRSAYIAVLFFGLGITVFVRSPALVVLYVFPLLAALFIARRGTFIDRDTITVRALFGTRIIAWSEVAGLLVNRRGGISAVLPDATAVRLPYVRPRHLPVLTRITAGTVPALPSGPPATQATSGDETPTDESAGIP